MTNASPDPCGHVAASRRQEKHDLSQCDLIVLISPVTLVASWPESKRTPQDTAPVLDC
jgi:hypothetical protein